MKKAIIGMVICLAIIGCEIPVAAPKVPFPKPDFEIIYPESDESIQHVSVLD